jgi:TetR/AcrR family transcriptional regulator, mexCD-oprJ operon repressor
MSTPRPTLRERVAAAIVGAAAEVLARRGEQANMNEVAEAAGVARATLYRYFPNRETLLRELAQHALDAAGERLEAAALERVPADEAVVRAIRALVDVGDYFIVLARARVDPDPAEFERRITAPLRSVLERGQADGRIRADVPAAWLTEALFGLVVSVLLAAPLLGADDRVATIGGLFLDGARPPQA